MVVIRSTPTKFLANAKPCENCIQTVKSVATKRGYKIHRIYYSNTEGEFEYVR